MWMEALIISLMDESPIASIHKHNDTAITR